MRRMRDLPIGTVTFLFTDIEGSTGLLQDLGRDEFVRQLDRHAEILRTAVAEQGGVEIGTEGDSFFVAFPTASGALRAAVAAQRALAAHPWSDGNPIRVRMGLHTGEGVPGGDNYVGIDVNRAARIAAAGHGGQIVISEATRVLVAGDVPDSVTLPRSRAARPERPRASGATARSRDRWPERRIPGVADAGSPQDQPASAPNLVRRPNTSDGRHREAPA